MGRQHRVNLHGNGPVRAPLPAGKSRVEVSPACHDPDRASESDPRTRYCRESQHELMQ